MVVVNGVDGLFRVGGEFEGKGFASLGVGFVKRSTGAGDGDTDAMPFVENLAEPSDGPAILVNGARSQLHFLFKALPVTCAQGVINDEDGASVGVDVAEAHDEVSVARCGAGKNLWQRKFCAIREWGFRICDVWSGVRRNRYY